ncbi:MAG: M23 family metallopeptidase [Alphaproteobacteria bacterium]|nr:M23 family metallopeptidase [Alphaproteobacteria bacterium]
MSRCGRFLALLILFAAITVPAVTLAADLPPGLPYGLQGHAVQGGMLRGHVAPGARVWVEGAAVKVAPDGGFLIGFSRTAPPRVTIEMAAPGTLQDAPRVTHTLDVGQRDYEIQRIDGLPDAQVSPGPAALDRIARDSAAIKTARLRASDTPLFTGGFHWPLTGTMTGIYGSQRILNGAPRSPHLGVDIAAPQGTPLLAPADGVVALVHDDMFFTGKTLILDHGHGLTSVYAHMSHIRVEEGESVTAGQVIATVGQSGRATGPHLHWGVHLGGVGLDPALLAGTMPP